MKLNLGCGSRKIPNWVNVDIDPSYGDDVVLLDIEFHKDWPWLFNSVDEVALCHVLEHIHDLKFVMKQLYWVCAPGARVYIAVPHPRHDDFLDDPTHVRPITANLLRTLDKNLNAQWKAANLSNSRLGDLWDVDFKLVEVEYTPDPRWAAALKEKEITEDDLKTAMRDLNNVIKECYFTLQVVK